MAFVPRYSGTNRVGLSPTSLFSCKQALGSKILNQDRSVGIKLQNH